MKHVAVMMLLFASWAAPLGFARGQGYAPQVAEEKITTIEGLRVKLFASEPEVRQPIFVKCDDRGRLWTIQYLQYPNPAGLKRVKVDRWSRTIYDREPKPPPHGPRGADRITILEDCDQDGRADKFTDFVDGLNLVTGVAFGHGGVFVMNVPYLLFYRDRNRDDVPDSDPEVLLTGFGMEDAQSMSNHLTWGPDGWLYGVNGSTTTCHIRGIEFQQGVWRYHPVTREFELFCEGGSNCYGITFDANGELYYSTNGGPFVHAMQGAYYFKSFGKHGPLHNLYAYHYFPNVSCDHVPGGPPTGGTIYLADALPKELHGTFVAGNFLGHTASWWEVIPAGSTFRAKYGGMLLDAHDTWFGPTDMCVGPNGSMYICDFHDQRTAHPDPDANWDRSNGRIYKIEACDSPPLAEFDLASMSCSELIDLLGHENHWFADRARCELASRCDQGVSEQLHEMATQSDDKQAALEGLWALHVTTGLEDALILELLKHPHPYVRYWAVRLPGDHKQVSDKVAHGFTKLAAAENHPVVKAQLACTANRLPASASLPLVAQLLATNPHESDARIPWLIWWAIEAHSVSAADDFVAMFSRQEIWHNPAARENGLRLVRRWAAEGTAATYAACAELLQSVPVEHLSAAHRHLQLGLAERSVGLHGIGQGGLFGGHAASEDGPPESGKRGYESLGGALREYIRRLWSVDQSDPVHLELALRADLPGSEKVLHSAAFDGDWPLERRERLLRLVRDLSGTIPVDRVRALLVSDESDSVRLAALDVAAKLDDDSIIDAILSKYEEMSPEMRSKARDVLFGRLETALAFLHHVAQGEFVPDEVPISQLRRLSVYDDPAIDELVLQHWGNIGPGTPEEKLAIMRRYNNDLRPGRGDPGNGKLLFAKHCGICHKFHGEGNEIGPDLTTANRRDRAALLANLVDPNAVVRREYVSFVLTTTAGQVLTGLLAQQNAASVTILDANNKRITVSRDDVDELVESEVSLMPERILENLTPQELRDLFEYLEK